MSTYRDLFEAELNRHGVEWCRGCDRYRSHKRGFATVGTVHYDAEIATRATLYGGLHEIAHVVLGHCGKGSKRSFVKEREAEQWARRRMREWGIAVPRSQVQLGNAYIARRRNHGDRVIATRTAR